tara:strand:+ start:144 stop:371 length:228 start_codon:yes stop_codon:yes gene_type:complete
MKITKQEIRKIIREEIEKEINQTTVTEDSFDDEEMHDDEDMDHLEKIRREMNRHIDMLKKQHDRAEGRHEYREDY